MNQKVLDSNPVKAVNKITRCPLLEEQEKLGRSTEDVCSACKEFNRNAAESLNPDYT